MDRQSLAPKLLTGTPPPHASFFKYLMKKNYKKNIRKNGTLMEKGKNIPKPNANPYNRLYEKNKKKIILAHLSCRSQYYSIIN